MLNVEGLIQILERDVVEASRALLGAIIVRGGMRARIVETEAYRGADDPACHAFGKKAMKNMALWSAPGNSYIYFTYGNHWMLNVVAHPQGDPSAVLIRAAEPLEGIDEMRVNRRVEDVRNLLSGPGKLAQAFGIDMRDNDIPLFLPPAPSKLLDPLYILPASRPVTNIVEGPRIGIAEGKWHDVPWRFADADRLEWVSRPLPPATKPGKRSKRLDV